MAETSNRGLTLGIAAAIAVGIGLAAYIGMGRDEAADPPTLAANPDAMDNDSVAALEETTDLGTDAYEGETYDGGDFAGDAPLNEAVPVEIGDLDSFIETQEAFLAANATKDGVITTKTGLQYRILKQGGGGAKPKAIDTVRVHYLGRFIDGQEFDSSSGGDPIEFPLYQVIPGWTEGVQLMSIGDKFEFTLPHDLAYGPDGAGADIPPYATLVFDVELLGIVPYKDD